MKIAAWIKEIREKNKLTQDQLAKKVGVSQPQISNWETGITSPSRDMVENISAVLGIRPPEVIELGEWLRKSREKKGLTQSELAKQAGISQLAISFIETGKTESPQQATIERLEKVLGPLPSTLTKEVKEERGKDFEFLGPFPATNWEENVGAGKIPCIYVFYDYLKRPVRIGETEDLRRRIREYQMNYWWFKYPIVDSFAYVIVGDAEFRRNTEKLMIKLVGEHAIFNTQDKIE
jgi:transcriptional regulator with XRE-family HTH domain